MTDLPAAVAATAEEVDRCRAALRAAEDRYRAAQAAHNAALAVWADELLVTLGWPPLAPGQRLVHSLPYQTHLLQVQQVSVDYMTFPRPVPWATVQRVTRAGKLLGLPRQIYLGPYARGRYTVADEAPAGDEKL